MSHTRTRHVANMKESCCTHKQVMLHIWMSCIAFPAFLLPASKMHVAVQSHHDLNKSWPIFEWVTPHFFDFRFRFPQYVLSLSLCVSLSLSRSPSLRPSLSHTLSCTIAVSFCLSLSFWSLSVSFSLPLYLSPSLSHYASLWCVRCLLITERPKTPCHYRYQI